jgi:hypothetical protein
MVLALLVMTTVQVGAYAKIGTVVFKSSDAAATGLDRHSHHAGHAATDAGTMAVSKYDLTAHKQAGKHQSNDRDCAVHCSPLAALASVHVQIMGLPLRNFEPVPHHVLASNVHDSQTRPPKYLI